MSNSKIDSESSHLLNMLLLMLSVANKLSENDTFLKHGLTVPEWALLHQFPAAEAEIDIKKLSNAIGLPPQRVKVLLAKLESRGTIQAVNLLAARGARRYSITSEGFSLKCDADKALADLQVLTLDASQARTLARAIRVTRRLFKAPRRDQSSQ